MSDRENLLNNLKIDRSAPPASEGQQSKKLYLFVKNIQMSTQNRDPELWISPWGY